MLTKIVKYSLPSDGPPYLTVEGGSVTAEFFYAYFFYHDFAKIYGLSEILQNYTSAVVAYGVRDIMS
jgi:hypothetical protein